MVARTVRDREVASSSLVTSTKKEESQNSSFLLNRIVRNFKSQIYTKLQKNRNCYLFKNNKIHVLENNNVVLI